MGEGDAAASLIVGACELATTSLELGGQELLGDKPCEGVFDGVALTEAVTVKTSDSVWVGLGD